MPRIEAEVIIDLDAPYSGPDKPKDAPFDLEMLLRAKGVPEDRIAMLDEDPST
ncbi:MAG: hypothetical protein H6811_09280 [Phycisphaeraceae bacterium]|nr:hypothetical protein [Phycisphaeraceae bacterium]